MSKYQGAVFFDIDGTLLDESQGIFTPTAKTCEAIEKVRENGYLVGIGTGRARHYIPDLNLDFDCYITSNGAVAQVKDQIILNHCISKDRVRELLELFVKEEIAFEVETPDCGYYLPQSEPSLKKFFDVFHVSMGTFFPREELEDIAMNKIVLFPKTVEQLYILQRKYKGEFDIVKHHGYLSADLGIKGINKASGLKKVLDFLDIPMENTYAFGDGDNDIEMLQGVSCGVAMNPASDGAIAAAKFQTKSVAEEGVSYALKKLGLI